MDDTLKYNTYVLNRKIAAYDILQSMKNLEKEQKHIIKTVSIPKMTIYGFKVSTK